MIKIYGSGDDLIIVEGDITAEFMATEELHFVVLSDGTVVELKFEDAVWKTSVVVGDSDYTIENPEDGDITSEIMTFEDSYDWVVFGNTFEARK